MLDPPACCPGYLRIGRARRWFSGGIREPVSGCNEFRRFGNRPRTSPGDVLRRSAGWIIDRFGRIAPSARAGWSERPYAPFGNSISSASFRPSSL